jgi:2'-5' RNA ligase
MTADGPAPGDESAASRQGRRILHAVVTGEAGARIQRWRERHDPEQARRYEPHVTLAYHVSVADLEGVGGRVQHAFGEPVEVTLGGVEVFDNPGRTAFVRVEEAGPLDHARKRLFDGRVVALPGAAEWRWHVTCIGSTADRSPELIEEARRELADLGRWRVSRVVLLELRGERYETLAEWDV